MRLNRRPHMSRFSTIITQVFLCLIVVGCGVNITPNIPADTSCSTTPSTTANSAAYTSQASIQFFGKGNFNTFDLETNEWTCSTKHAEFISELEGEDARQVLQAASQLSEGMPQVSMYEISKDAATQFDVLVDEICDHIKFPVRFKPPNDPNVIGCQISGLAKSAIMFLEKQDKRSITVAYSKIYQPIINRALTGLDL